MPLVRIPRPKIGKLAFQAQGEGIFANGEIPVQVGQDVRTVRNELFFFVEPTCRGHIILVVRPGFW